MIRKLGKQTRGKLLQISELYAKSRKGIPVNLDVISSIVESVMPCKIYTSYPGELSHKGLLSPSENNGTFEYRMMIRAGMDRIETRFTRAHEIGHVIVTPEYGFNDILIKRSDYREYEHMVDMVAGYLLCPWEHIWNLLYDPPVFSSHPNLFRCRSHELLLLEAMARKLQVPVMTLYWQIREIFKGAYLKLDRIDQVLSIFSNPLFGNPKFKKL